MKRNFIFVVAVACATLSFSSCKKEAKPVEEQAVEQATEQATEVKTEEAVSVNSVDAAIDEYEKLTNDLIVIMKDMKAGKTDAASKMQEMSTKYQEVAAKFSNTASFTPAQTEKLKKIAEKYMEGIK